MADTDVGKKGTFHSNQGDVPCKVLAYEAGRKEGDHYIAGFALPDAPEKVFALWTVVSSKVGGFSI